MYSMIASLPGQGRTHPRAEGRGQRQAPVWGRPHSAPTAEASAARHGHDSCLPRSQSACNRPLPSRRSFCVQSSLHPAVSRSWLAPPSLSSLRTPAAPAANLTHSTGSPIPYCLHRVLSTLDRAMEGQKALPVCVEAGQEASKLTCGSCSKWPKESIPGEVCMGRGEKRPRRAQHQPGSIAPGSMHLPWWVAASPPTRPGCLLAPLTASIFLHELVSSHNPPYWK